MKRNVIILLLFLATTLSAQVTAPSLVGRAGGEFALPSPTAIRPTDGTLQLIAVEPGGSETRIRLHASPGWAASPSAYLSDEADRRHLLLRSESEGDVMLLTFEALPKATRVFDLVLDGQHRLMGIHSAVRGLRLSASHPRYDERAATPDSILAIIRAAASAASVSGSAPLTPQALALYRDYVAWKWHLTPHEVFLLQRELRPAPAPFCQGGEASGRKPGGSAQPTPLPDGRGSRVGLSSLPRAPKPTRRERKRFSRFEQKMLQEHR